jgi:hypothetical protein
VSEAAEEAGAWHEIVGVVGDLGMDVNAPSRSAGLYHPIAPGARNPIRLAVHVGPDGTSLAPRLRSIAAAAEPTLLVDVQPLATVFSEDHFSARWLTLLLTLLASISVVLSAAGLAALMSFTVSERTREIGIRAALGAGPARIVSAVLTRAAAQLVVGAALGVPMAVALVEAMDAEFAMSLPWPVVYAGAALLVVIIGLLACARPTLRGLGIRPSEALRGS